MPQFCGRNTLSCKLHKSRELQKPNDITLFYLRTVQMTGAFNKIYFILSGNSKALACKLLHN